MGFQAALDAILHGGLNENRVHPTMVLALGMMLAEFNRTEFSDPDEEASSESASRYYNTASLGSF